MNDYKEEKDSIHDLVKKILGADKGIYGDLEPYPSKGEMIDLLIEERLRISDMKVVEKEMYQHAVDFLTEMTEQDFYAFYASIENASEDSSKN